MDKKKIILEYIENESNTKQINFIYNLLNLPSYPSKIDLLELINENSTTIKCDFAVPVDLYKDIERVYKNIYKSNLIFNYSNNKFGELININDMLASYILRLKK